MELGLSTCSEVNGQHNLQQMKIPGVRIACSSEMLTEYCFGN